MLQNLPNYITTIAKKFSDSGYELYLVGGCVRNILLSKPVSDWDLTTNATPQQILQLFPDAFYDNQFGTVGIPIPPNGGIQQSNEVEKNAANFKSQTSNLKSSVVEITTFRSESEYRDHRHPEKITWGKTIQDDLSRRDFTINAMAISLKLQISNPKPNLIDLFNGQNDLENHTIRAVGNPDQRFKEDALRLMRAIRFATQLGFIIEETTWKAIKLDANLLAHISPERIHDELLKILASDNPFEGIMLLKNAGLLNIILPELLEGEGLSQARPGRHHTADVFTHNVQSLKFCPSIDPIVRFATLIHDIGKPRVEGKDENGLVIFYNHEVAGAKLAHVIANRLRFSKKDREKITALVRWHMFTIDENITDAAVRRFIRRIGVENVKDMMDLRIGDRLGGGTQTAESWRLKKFKQRVEEQLQPAPFSINDLAIDGHDIMKILDIKPGPQIGILLKTLFEEVDEDLSKNTKDYLTSRVKKLYTS